MNLRRHAVLVLAMLPLADAPLVGQQLGLAPELRALRQPLARVADRDSLRHHELRLIEVAKGRRDDPLPHLELGFIALRLGEVTGFTRHYEDAVDEFAMATELRPTWWIGWYGQAVAELGVRATELGIFSMFKAFSGHDAEAIAAAKLAQSAALDSLRAEGLVDFGRAALAKRDPMWLSVARAALTQADSGPARGLRDVRLLRGLVEREFERFDLSMAALEPLLRDFPDDAEIQLELADTRFSAGRLDGVALWYAALAGADSALLARFGRDLVLVMPDSTLSAIVASPGAERVAIAKRFWDDQNRGGIPVTAERLRDHFQWLRFARKYYLRVAPPTGVALLPGMKEGNAEFDARGVVTVLHGPPKLRSVLNLPGMSGNESWAYPDRLGGDTLLFHFIRPFGERDYVSVESVLDLFRLSGQARFMTPMSDTTADGRPVIGTYGASLTAQTSQELFISREPLSPIYTRMFNEGRNGAVALQQAEREIGVRSNAAGSSWEFGFELPLAVQADVVAIGQGPGGRAVQLAYAMPGTAITPVYTIMGAHYHVRVRAAVRDASGAVVATVDTMRTFRSNGILRPDELILGRVPVTLPPGEYTVQMALNADERGTVLPTQRVTVAAMSGTRLALSDLVLGTRRTPLTVPTSLGDTAWVNPTRRFARGTPMQLYLEVAGLEAESRYEVELAFVRPGGSPSRDRTALKLSFAGVHPGGTAGIEREVNLSRLAPGSYRLDVTVRTADGTRALRQREFTIVR
ncbi:MAG: hypothetical protein SFU84_15525 [Gemmatimonadales bacterium]|nr:hypothetical protein [Gemmatimonadales bacterium]